MVAVRIAWYQGALTSGNHTLDTDLKVLVVDVGVSEIRGTLPGSFSKGGSYYLGVYIRCPSFSSTPICGVATVQAQVVLSVVDAQNKNLVDMVEGPLRFKIRSETPAPKSPKP